MSARKTDHKNGSNYLECGGYRVIAECGPDEAEALVAGIAAGSVGFDEVYKNEKKGLVATFSHPALGKLVVKIPRARNRRQWERFLTLFRDGESFRRFKDLKHFRELGFNGPEPVLAAEKRISGMVTDGFYIYRFVRGRLADNRDYNLIVPELLRLHRRGYIRRDPRVANYVIGDDGKVFFIDFKLKKPRLMNRVRCVTEFRRFLLGCPEGAAYSDQAADSKVIYFLASLNSLYITRKRIIRRSLVRKLERRAVRSGGPGG